MKPITKDQFDVLSDNLYHVYFNNIKDKIEIELDDVTRTVTLKYLDFDDTDYEELKKSG